MYCQYRQTINLAVMKTIKTKINGKVETLNVREFNGMYQILSGQPYAMGMIRKDEVL